MPVSRHVGDYTQEERKEKVEIWEIGSGKLLHRGFRHRDANMSREKRDIRIGLF
ncbi:hypothetical protein R3X27_16345 [Tropicimonas sp. TH_r6]|uniref:hypothetical protein n=1 Tax=Tropicimonas sp. TH_r6 TaxID=3082085 RepID=UPI0029538C3F|nr:hypothetical protein [Tropicimonas sp. TH_r6]MDV7144257.1 hypothetical protein [Tropicimonas sp. TH_r6]